MAYQLFFMIHLCRIPVILIEWFFVTKWMELWEKSSFNEYWIDVVVPVVVVVCRTLWRSHFFFNRCMIHSNAVLFYLILFRMLIIYNVHIARLTAKAAPAPTTTNEANKKETDTHKPNKEFEHKKRYENMCSHCLRLCSLFSIPSVNVCTRVYTGTHYICIFGSIVCKASINYSAASRLDDVWLNCVYKCRENRTHGDEKSRALRLNFICNLIVHMECVFVYLRTPSKRASKQKSSEIPTMTNSDRLEFIRAQMQ